ncbi:MAG: type III secretion inner membrane ring lipoprotein SctJ [Candidatus Competibacteraceae bacterium]|nr:type III secretion inner membrane ring lipoprotein SctJ [Candidatus Competibacteraceae bacterium]
MTGLQGFLSREQFCKRAILSVLLLAIILLAGCKMELYSQLPENDANDMMAILLRNGINSEKIPEKKTGTFAIHVQQGQMPTAVALLKGQGFPKEKHASMKDLFKKEGLISSPLEERIRFIYGLSQDVQETLSRIDGVITARVHIVLPENDPFTDRVKPSSASVFIKYLPESHLEDIKSEIKLIVEKSIEGLSYDKVSVVMLPAEIPEITLQSGSFAGITELNTLKAMVWGMGGVLIVTLGGCGYLGWRLYRQPPSDPMAAGGTATKKRSAQLLNLSWRRPNAQSRSYRSS